MEFGDKLERIGEGAFEKTSIRSIKLQRVRDIGIAAFAECLQLTEVELSKDLETVGGGAFVRCPLLRRIALPLKENMLENDVVFRGCDDLSQIHRHSWRDP